MTIEKYFWVIPLFPLLSFGLIVLLTNKSKSLSHWLAIAGAGIAWALSMWAFFRAVTAGHLADQPFNVTFNWLPTGDTWLKLGALIDPLSAVTLFFVAWTVLMIFIYSVGYHNYGQPRVTTTSLACRRMAPLSISTVFRQSNRCIRVSLPSSACLLLQCTCWC